MWFGEYAQIIKAKGRGYHPSVRGKPLPRLCFAAQMLCLLSEWNNWLLSGKSKSCSASMKAQDLAVCRGQAGARQVLTDSFVILLCCSAAAPEVPMQKSLEASWRRRKSLSCWLGSLWGPWKQLELFWW